MDLLSNKGSVPGFPNRGITLGEDSPRRDLVWCEEYRD